MKELLAILFLLLSISDILSTRIAVHLGFFEKNWIVHKIVEEYGYKGHYIVKGLTTAMFLAAIPIIDTTALIVLNIVFALIVVSNLWKIAHA